MGKRRSSWASLLRGLLLPALAAGLLVFFSAALDNVDSGRNEEERRQLEEALRRSCIACYAAEGVYPPGLDYLKEHYGIRVDEERYTAIYTALAENLTPDITVLVNKT